MRPFRSLAPLLVCLGLAAACVGGATPSEGPGSPARAAASFPFTLVDDAGVRVTLDRQPQRIVTFAPSNTEIVYALGLGDRLVGVSGRYDDYPPEAKRVEEIGGAGDFGADPNIEKVVALQPDLMLAISGGDEWKAELRDLGVPVFTINATDFDDLLHDIRTVGRLTGAVGSAASLTERMASVAKDIEGAAASSARVSCFFEVFYPPLTTVGPDTFIADLLNRAGCDSVSAGAKRDYPEWSVDDLVRRQPAVYLVSSESGVSPGDVAKRPGFDAIEAVARGDVVLIDSDLISRPGPRVVQGLQELATALHQEAGL